MKPAFPLAPIRLLLVDIDGTMIGPDLTVKPRVQKTLMAARERGVHVALCTGRPEISSRHYIEPLNLTGYHIFDSGATIRDPLADQTLYQKGVPNEVAVDMLNYARQHNVYLEVYGPGTYYVGYEDEHSRFHAELQGVQPTIADLASIVANSPLVKLEAVAMNDAEAQRAQAMLDQFSDRLDFGWAIVPGHPTRFVNILAQGVSKGEAVQRLMEHMNISPAQTMGVGDGPNDEPLLKMVGFGVAMGNSADSLKQIASWVAPSVDEDGLAVAIEQHILGITHRV